MNNNDIDYESSDDGDSVPPPPSQTHHTSNYENLNDETDSLNDILSNNRDFRNNNNMSNNMINDTNDDYAFQNANTTSDLSNLLLSPNNNNNNNNKDIHHLTNPQLHGIHHAQEYDEEAAANEEIEVRGSSIVATMNRREKERGMENFDEDLNKDGGAGIAGVCSGRRKRKRCLLIAVAGCAVAALIAGIVTAAKPRATVISRLEDAPVTGTDTVGTLDQTGTDTVGTLDQGGGAVPPPPTPTLTLTPPAVPTPHDATTSDRASSTTPSLSQSPTTSPTPEDPLATPAALHLLSHTALSPDTKTAIRTTGTPQNNALLWLQNSPANSNYHESCRWQIGRITGGKSPWQWDMNTNTINSNKTTDNDKKKPLPSTTIRTNLSTVTEVGGAAACA